MIAGPKMKIKGHDASFPNPCTLHMNRYTKTLSVELLAILLSPFLALTTEKKATRLDYSFAQQAGAEVDRSKKGLQ